MVSCFDRYIAWKVFSATLAILMALAMAVWLSQSLRFIDLTVNRGLPAPTFLLVSILALPNFLTVILPISLFTATLFIYNGLQADSELLVMRAAGLGPHHIIRPAILVMLLALCAGYGLTLYGLPASYRAFKDMQASLRNNLTAVLVQEGVFTQLDEKLTLFVQEQGKQGDLFGIMVHDGRISQRPATYIADRGAIRQSSEGARLVMMNGNRQELDQATGRVSFLFFDRYTVNINRVTGETGARLREGTERYLDELLWPEKEIDARTQRSFLVEAHQRLAAPLLIPAFLAIAFSVLLSREFNRRGQAVRILVAIALGTLVQGLFFAFTSLANRVNGAALFLYLLPLATMAISALVISRSALAFPAPETR